MQQLAVVRTHRAEFESNAHARYNAAHHSDDPDGRVAHINSQAAWHARLEFLRGPNQETIGADIHQVAAKTDTPPEKANYHPACCLDSVCSSLRHFKCRADRPEPGLYTMADPMLP